MSIKGQAVTLIDVIDHLEMCIDEIKSTGDLSEWMSPDGIDLLNTTLTRLGERRPILERLINTPPHDVSADFVEAELKSETESFESLFYHLTGTLKLATERQNALHADNLKTSPTEDDNERVRALAQVYELVDSKLL